MASIKETLQQLISGLLFSSESDYPLTLLDWGNISDEEISKQIIANYTSGTILVSVPADYFFNHYILRQQTSGDDQMIANAARFQQLFDYLKANFTSINVWRCGSVKVGIYIVLKTNEDDVLVLQTTSVET